MELWKVPEFTSGTFRAALDQVPEEMSLNEKQSWREGFHAGFGFWLTAGVCIIPETKPREKITSEVARILSVTPTRMSDLPREQLEQYAAAIVNYVLEAEDD